MQIIKKILYLLSPKNKKKLVVLSILLFIGMMFEMVGLGILIPTINLISNSNSDSKIRLYLVDNFKLNDHFSLVIYVMIFLVLVYLLKTLFLVYLSYFQSKFTSNLSDELSQSLFDGYLRMPYKFHLIRNSTELQRNIQSEINNFNQASQSGISLLSETAIIFGILFFLFIIEPIGAISIVVSLSFFTILFYLMTKQKVKDWGIRRLYLSAFSTLHLNQGLNGVKDVKIKGKEFFFVNEYAKFNSEIARIQAKISTMSFVPRLYLEFISIISLATLIIVLSIQGKPIDSLITVLGVFVAAAFRIIPSANRIIGSIQQIKVAEPIVQLLYKEFKEINLIPNINKTNKSELNQKKISQINLNNISFSYDDSKDFAIKNINLTITAGSFIGIIGKSGSGKSTLVDLILGLLYPQEGSIDIDGETLNHESYSFFRDIVGYVPQVIYLTDSSLKSNIAFGVKEEEIDYEALEMALELAQLSELVNSLPNGLDTFVGERGVRLSGGQRQRIGIARALYGKPQILILDEATSALDNNTENEIMNAVNKLHGNKTVIIIAHRLSTIKNCDIVYKVESGMILESGLYNDFYN
jgi:ABC-type multidrug transport system fused ATPase/permease subunit